VAFGECLQPVRHLLVVAACGTAGIVRCREVRICPPVDHGGLTGRWYEHPNHRQRLRGVAMAERAAVPPLPRQLHTEEPKIDDGLRRLRPARREYRLDRLGGQLAQKGVASWVGIGSTGSWCTARSPRTAAPRRRRPPAGRPPASAAAAAAPPRRRPPPCTAPRRSSDPAVAATAECRTTC
jgi:hypothetical protein